MRIIKLLPLILLCNYLLIGPNAIAQQTIQQQVPPSGQQQPPIQVAWSAWTEWSSCNAICGTGVQERARQCFSSQNLPVLNGYCSGHARELRACSGGPPCPIQSPSKQIQR